MIGVREALQYAVTSTQPPAMMRSGDQKLLIKLRQLGKDMTDPIKALVAAHEERAVARKQEAALKSQATLKGVKRRHTQDAPGELQTTVRKAVKKQAMASDKCVHGKKASDKCVVGKTYYENVVKIKAHTAGRERVYFMGRPCGGDKKTLIIECTQARCNKFGKDYEDIAEYMWLMVADGTMSKERAKREFEKALEA